VLNSSPFRLRRDEVNSLLEELTRSAKSSAQGLKTPEPTHSGVRDSCLWELATRRYSCTTMQSIRQCKHMYTLTCC